MNPYDASNSAGRGRSNNFHGNRGVREGVVRNFNRHCIECGSLIKNQVVEKPVVCPFSNCRALQPFRNGAWAENGWGRCPSCDNFMNSEHCYCQCGWANLPQIQRKKQQQLALVAQRNFNRDQYVRQLEEERMQDRARMEEMRKQLEEITADKVIASVEIPVDRPQNGVNENRENQEAVTSGVANLDISGDTENRMVDA